MSAVATHAEPAVCPPSGRARAAWRRTKALQLATEGKPWDDIAREVGYSNRGTAHKTVMRALNARTVGAIEDHRASEVERLDALQAALWDRAMSGDVEAAEAVRNIVLARCRVLGLLPRSRRRAGDDGPPRTVVIGVNA